MLVGLSSCATYAERTAHGRADVAVGSYDKAIRSFNAAIGVDDVNQLPARGGSNAALILLERGMASQARGDFVASARDLGEADKRLEVIDIASDPVGTLGKYFYSDSAAAYRASPVEKLALNSMNLLNYLALDDLAGARVEAKRYTVMRDYLKDTRPGSVHGTAGAYLAGFLFERLGESGEAVRYYDDALAAGDLVSIASAVHRMARATQYRGKNIADYVSRQPPNGPLDRNPPTEILTVVSLGRVPVRRPERIPIGAAVGLAGRNFDGDANFLGHSVMKVLVYPDLQPSRADFGNATVAIDGLPVGLELVSNFAAEISAEYEQAKPAIIGAALSRMVVRAAAAEGAREAGKQVGGNDGNAVGWIAALLTETALVVFDKPDTRSWTLLPGLVYISRQTVSPGTHEVEVVLQGNTTERRRFDVEVPDGGFATIVVTPLR